MEINKWKIIWLLAYALFAENLYAENAQAQAIKGGIQDCPAYSALAGDRKATAQCVTHYLKDPEPRRYWERIAAENGDAVAQYNYAMTLLSGKNRLERKRAEYWLKKAAAQGDKMASKALDDVREHPDALFPLPPPARK